MHRGGSPIGRISESAQPFVCNSIHTAHTGLQSYFGGRGTGGIAIPGILAVYTVSFHAIPLHIVPFRSIIHLSASNRFDCPDARRFK